MSIKGKVLVGIFVLLLAASSITAIAESNSNLISNPSVEEKASNMPKDWLKTKSGNNVSVFNYKEDPQEGIKSLYINVTQYKTGFSAWYFKDTQVEPSKEYEYSEYYKSTMETELFVRFTDSSGKTTLASLGKVEKSDDWKKITKSFSTPSDIKTLTVMHRTNSLGTLVTDNFSLTLKGNAEEPSPTPTPTPDPTPDPTPTPTPSGNLIPNESVETVNPNNSNLPKYWTKVKTGTNNAAFTYLKSGAHTGNRALQIKITSYTSGLAYYQFDPVTIQGGKTYDYKFFYKSDVYTELDAEITKADGTIEYQYLGVTYPSSNDWNQFRSRISLPSNAVKVRIYNLIYSKGFLISDDFSLTEAHPVPFNRAIVTLTFDDAFDNFYNYAFPIFKKYDMSATLYLVSQDFDQPLYMNKAKLLELDANGFEFGSHSATHPHFPLLTTAQAEAELLDSKTVIQNYLGINIKNFASPYGEYNDSLLPLFKKYYQSHRSVDVGYNTKDVFSSDNILAFSADVNTKPETVLGWVDEAIRQNAWFVIVYHDIVNNGGTWTNTPAHLDTVLKGLKDRGVPVKTIEQGLAEILPQM